MGVEFNSKDRRSSERMDIERDVQYRVLNGRNGETGANGKTLNISSSGVLFSTPQALMPGRRLELAINWPAKLDNKCSLKLVARGRVVRFEDGFAAFEILQHEFRTKGRASEE